jgi:hypothetical protein
MLVNGQLHDPTALPPCKQPPVQFFQHILLRGMHSLSKTSLKVLHAFSKQSCSKISPIWWFWFTTCVAWSWILLKKPPVAQLLKNFPTFYGTRRFITVYTRVLYCSLSWAISIQSIPPHPISLRYILILSIHLGLSFPSGLFPYGFPTKILYAFLFFPIRASYPAHLIFLYFIIVILLGEEYKLRSFSLCSFLICWK